MSKKDIGRFDSLQYDCKKCGKHCDLEYYDHQAPLAIRMRQKSLCFHCAFWDLFKIEQPERYEVCDGKIYEYGDPLFLINTKSGNVRTRYVWHYDRSIKRIHFSRFIGEVPADQNIENTGKIITYELFKKLERKKRFSCRAIGCYDRYHCYWYDKELREPNGPWNEIPERHKVGDEHCQSFLDKETMFNTKTNE